MQFHHRLLALVLIAVPLSARAADEVPWPPALPGAAQGTVTLESKQFLEVPESVAAARGKEGAAPFAVAKTPPAVDFAYHQDLGANAAKRRLWSSWGDICLASDGRVYCGIGDHGDDVGGDARCFLYRWDPARKTLVQIVDMNQLVPPQAGQPAWSKIHAKIDEGTDGKIYFCCTLNDGNRASKPNFGWTERLPGGQIYRFDPQTGKAEVFASLPPKRCTATSLLDRQRNIWWCNLEAGEGNALWGIDLSTRQAVQQTPDKTVAFNRNFALAADGSLYFNGEESLMRLDGKTGKVERKAATFGTSPGMRASSRESKQGIIYGATHSTTQLFAYLPANDELKLLGPTWLAGDYTTVTELSPDERFLYYLPGAHGKAFLSGTPVLQYELATGKRKVLAFLAPAMEKELGYVPAGTYGVKISADGGTLYVNFNGHPADSQRPATMKPNGFGLTSFAAIHIPAAER